MVQRRRRYQPPLVRTAAPSIVISKPVLSRGFNPKQIFDLRAPGVVTVFSYFGKTPRTSSIEEAQASSSRAPEGPPTSAASPSLNWSEGALRSRLRSAPLSSTETDPVQLVG